MGYFVPAHDESGVGGRGGACSGGVSGRGWAMRRFSLDLVSEKRLGGVRTTTRSRNSIRVYLDRWRGLERPLEVCL